jgi:hypothetical protein
MDTEETNFHHTGATARREEAEEYALTLCRAWIDGLGSESKKTKLMLATTI